MPIKKRKRATISAKEAWISDAEKRLADLYAGANGSPLDDDGEYADTFLQGGAEVIERWFRAIADTFKPETYESTSHTWCLAHWNIAKFANFRTAAGWLWECQSKKSPKEIA